MTTEPTVVVRPYSGGDEAGIVRCWNASLPLDPISGGLFRTKVLLDANFDPVGALVALDGAGNVIGFALAIVRRVAMWGADLEPDDGWITVFFVDPNWRRQGIGTRLLEQAEDFLKARGRSTVRVSPYAPGYFWPGIDVQAYSDAVAFLQGRGYRIESSPASMDISLLGYSVPADVLALRAGRERDGYRFGTLKESEITRLIDFAQREFGADWARAIREGLPRGLPESRFIVCSQGREVLGFALFGVYDDHAERFGPFGVSAAARGLGLGKILLHEALHRMRAAGLHSAWFLWADEGTPAERLYLRTGFCPARRFAVMGKPLSIDPIQGGVSTLTQKGRPA